MSFSIRRAASAKAPSRSTSPPSPPTCSTTATTPTPSSPVAAALGRPAGLRDLVGIAHQRSPVPHRAGPRRSRRAQAPRETCPASSTSTSTPRAGSTSTPATTRSDPLGRGPAADALRAVLDMADQVIVPIETEPLSFDPTARTINKVLEPRGVRYIVVINNWDPRDGTARPQRDQGIRQGQRMAAGPHRDPALQAARPRQRRRPGGHRVPAEPGRAAGARRLLQVRTGTQRRGRPLMARGQRTNLAALAGAVGDNSPVDQVAAEMPEPHSAVERADRQPAQPPRRSRRSRRPGVDRRHAAAARRRRHQGRLSEAVSRRRRSPPATSSSTGVAAWPPRTSTDAPTWRSSSTTRSPATASR